MELFEEVFNTASIYDMLFFNIKAVLTYPTLEELQKENPALYERWKYVADTKYDAKIVDANHAQTIYDEKAIYHPEFTKILAITYATVRMENGQPKRFLKKISNQDEFLNIAMFMDILFGLSSAAVQSSPPYFPVLCGHNIMGYDIPLLIKRFLFHRDRFKELRKQENPNAAVSNLLPLILKRALSSKPWESKIIDTVNVWKFNGNDYTTLMLITDHLGLKKTTDLESLPDVSRNYWNLVNENPDKALEYVAFQSATQVNLVIQLMNELRLL